MNRLSVTITCTLLSALLIWLGLTVGLTTARADLSAPAPATPSAATTAPATTAPAAIAAATRQPSNATTSSSDSQPFARDSLPLRVAPGPWGRTPLMTRPYMVLLTRSMFVRGHVAEASHVGVPVVPRPSGPRLALAETAVVFNGVTLTNATIDALVEDTSTGRVLTVHSGDAVARGKVGKITMDSLEYVHDGKVTSVAIGQNFAGGSADVSSSPAASQPASSGLSPQDILEKLRQKRMQEMGPN